MAAQVGRGALYSPVDSGRLPFSRQVLFESLMEEAVFEELRVIRVGKLRILFNHVMQMRLWEFSIEGHCNLVPHRLIINKLQHLKDMNAEIQKRAMTVLSQRNQTPQQQEE
jgi:hypothetical protein